MVTGANVWGQLRFLPNGTQSSVSLQFRPEGAAEFGPLGEPVPVTDARGFFSVDRPAPGPGTMRAVWNGPGGAAVASREVPVG